MSLTGAGDAAHVQVDNTLPPTSSAFCAFSPCSAASSATTNAAAGRDAVAVLNYGFWQRNFAGDPSVLGRKIELDQRTYTIIGVLPKSVQYPSEADIFLPFAPTPSNSPIAATTTTSSKAVCAMASPSSRPRPTSAPSPPGSPDIYPTTNRGWTIARRTAARCHQR